MNLEKHFDKWSLLVMAITLILFVAALFLTGFTHALLLETGVFLVSVKLMQMAYKTSIAYNSLSGKLDEIQAALQRLETAPKPPDTPARAKEV